LERRGLSMPAGNSGPRLRGLCLERRRCLACGLAAGGVLMALAGPAVQGAVAPAQRGAAGGIVISRTCSACTPAAEVLDLQDDNQHAGSSRALTPSARKC
jgi:hypothetical protein